MRHQWCFTFCSIYLIFRNFLFTCFLFIINSYQITIAYGAVVLLSVLIQVRVIKRVKFAKVHDGGFCCWRIIAVVIDIWGKRQCLCCWGNFGLEKKNIFAYLSLFKHTSSARPSGASGGAEHPLQSLYWLLSTICM